MIVLDNNVLVEIERGNKELINKILNLGEDNPENPAITSAVYAEFLFGFLVTGKEKEVEKYLKGFEMIDFDKNSARKFAELKMELDNKGTPIPIFDLVTASCVMIRNATLVSFDKHFEKVPGLKVISLNSG